MSLILDALKKLDRQKTSRWTRTANIALEILKPHPPLPGKRTSTYLAAVLLAVVATAAVTYAVLAGFGFLSKSPPPSPVKYPLPSQKVIAAPKADSPAKVLSPAPVKTAAPSPQVAPVQEAGPPPEPSTPAPAKAAARSQRVAPSPESDSSPKPSALAPVKGIVPSRQMVPASPSPEPGRSAPDKAGRMPTKIQTQVESKIPTTARDEKKASPSIIPEKAGFAPGYTEKPAEPTANGPAATPPPLKISGILWDEEPSKRRAVINGTFATEGSTIEGVKVVEIYPTRVRFLQGGRSFEVSIF